MKNKKQVAFQSLKGHFLIAMPNIDDLRFEKAVIYIYEHTELYGARGIVINRPADKMTFGDILSQLKINGERTTNYPPIVLGGPNQVTHGFILHSNDYKGSDTVCITDNVYLTSTQNILEDIVTGKGPQKNLIALGCATWIRGQLEDEIMSNVWLTTPAQNDILFNIPFNRRWENALEFIGIHSVYLSNTAGRS